MRKEIKCNLKEFRTNPDNDRDFRILFEDNMEEEEVL